MRPKARKGASPAVTGEALLAVALPSGARVRFGTTLNFLSNAAARSSVRCRVGVLVRESRGARIVCADLRQEQATTRTCCGIRGLGMSAWHALLVEARKTQPVVTATDLDLDASSEHIAERETVKDVVDQCVLPRKLASVARMDDS